MADVTQDDRIVDPQVPEEEREFDAALRPRRIDEFVGQDRVKEQLALLIDGARARGETVDHLLFSGPPGLGKTTLAGSSPTSSASRSSRRPVPRSTGPATSPRS
jgi:Holliday junction DNA helicase RuvB